MTIWALQRRTIFLSTPSARRATTRRPRSNPQCGISIHALREEGDVASINLTSSIFQFLSTPSARRATAALVPICGMRRNFYPRPPRGGRPAKARKVFQGHTISIHALREEGDPGVRHCPPGDADFYPRPPRGGRRNPQQGDTISKPISIHALREEGDCGVSELVRRAGNFYPRPPRGGQRSKKYSASGTWQFLSTPSARRATPAPFASL